MGVLDFLNAGQPPPAPTSADTTVNAPTWIQDYLYSTLGAAQAVASQSFNPFPGPTVAAPSNATQQSWNMAGANVGNYQPYLNQAGALTQAAGSPISSSDVSTFLNPYQDYVTGALNRNLQQNILPSIQDRFVGSGQSRSPQELEMTQRAAQDTQTAIGQSLAGGYQGAVNSLLQQRQQQGAAGSQFGTLATSASNLGAMDVGQVAAAGNAQDTLAQQNLNAAMQQFQQQQQYPYDQLGFLSNVVRGLPTNQAGSNTQTSGTTYNYNPTPSPLAQFLGGVLGGNQLSKSLGLRRGGRVPAMGALSRLRRAA